MKEKKQGTGRRHAGRFLGIVLAVIMMVTMLPLTAMADDPDDRGWGDAVYVLGKRITSENCGDVLGDGGSVRYDHETRTIYLTNATIDLANYHMDADENNTVFGIDTFRDLKIVLSGTNKIVSTAQQFTEDKEYVYGLSATDEVSISGDGSLEISIQTAQNGIQAYYGIDSSRKLVVDGSTVAIKMSGTGKNTGIHAGFRGYELKNNAKVQVVAEGSNSTAVYDISFAGSPIESGSSLEMISDNRALQYTRLNASVEERGALVNTEAAAAGASVWDKQTRLSEYKYILLPDPDGSESGRGWADNVYILGKLITAQNCNDVLGDGGSVKYNFDEKKLTLTNAALNLEAYVSPAAENNYVAGVNTFGSIDIELVGENRIFGDGVNYEADKEYVYGITAQDALSITGSGSLEIEIHTQKPNVEFTGIDSGRLLTVGCEGLDVLMTGAGKCTGIDLFWSGIHVEQGAVVFVYADGEQSTAVADLSFGKSVIEDGAVLQMASEHRAFSYTIAGASITEKGALVNTEATNEGAFEWDKETRLDTYKYVRIPANDMAKSDLEAAQKVMKMLAAITKDSTPAEAGEAVEAYFKLTKKQQAIIKANKTAMANLEFAMQKAMEPQPADISYAQVTLAKSSYVYNGKKQKPAVTVRMGTDLVLKEGTDYTVDYKNNLNAGTATAIITGKGAYRGEAKKNFKIKKAENTLTAKAKKKTRSAKQTKKTTIKKTQAFTIKNAIGKVTFKKKSGNKKISINQNTGTITVKKGLKAGDYKVVIIIRAAGDKNHNPASKNVKLTIQVK